MDSIANFVKEIACDLLPQEDRLMKQKAMCPHVNLVKPLPLDSTGGAVKLITQELYHAGPDAEKFFRRILIAQNTVEQDKPIFCCAATSGIGKTRLAYATGKMLTLILIRVANNPLSPNPFTSPWNALCKKLSPLEAQRDQSGGSEEKSAKALLYIKVLICCYVDATTCALEIGKKYYNLDTFRLRELALRFNRNGIGENIIMQLFESKCREMLDGNDLYDAKTKFKKYLNDINDRFEFVFSCAREGLLLCFDEIQELLNRYPRLFIQKSRYGQKEVVNDDMSRDLFYGVACAMKSITFHCRMWTMFMTGTHLSISQLNSEKGVSSSLLRHLIEQISIEHSLMTNREMKDMLQYYWDIPEETFTEPLMEALDQFRGRPYFFVEFVFRHVYSIAFNHPSPLTSDALLLICSGCLNIVSLTMERRIKAMFAANKAIPGAGDRTVTSLIPLLVKTTICGNGKVVLEGDLDVSQAIVNGVILASSCDAPNTIKDIRGTEPIVYHCLVKYLSSLSIERVMHLVLNQISGERGATAEEMFSYWVALNAYAYIRRGRRGIGLGDLLRPLYDGPVERHYPMALLNQYICDATKVVNLDNADFVPSLTFVHNGDSSIKNDTVFYGINNMCGVDIIFVARNIHDNSQKLVAIQSKNDKSITVKEVMMTLSPGLQYLENPYREYVITGKFPKKQSPADRSCGPGFASWEAWKTFCTTYNASIGNNWIRIALVSRRVSPEIHDYISADHIVERYDEKTKSLYWRLFSPSSKRTMRNEKQQKAVLAKKLSPLVFLSLAAPTWLTDSLRERFINTRPNDTGIALPREGRKSVYWIPVSVEEAGNSLAVLSLHVNVVD